MRFVADVVDATFNDARSAAWRSLGCGLVARLWQGAELSKARKRPREPSLPGEGVEEAESELDFTPDGEGVEESAESGLDFTPDGGDAWEDPPAKKPRTTSEGNARRNVPSRRIDF